MDDIISINKYKDRRKENIELFNLRSAYIEQAYYIEEIEIKTWWYKLYLRCSLFINLALILGALYVF